MKSYIKILIISILLTSCSKNFLNKEPHELTDAVFWKTAAQAESGLAGVYSALMDEDALGGQEWAAIEAMSDNAYMNDNYADYIAISEFRAVQNTEFYLSLNPYKTYYKVIKRATDVLKYVPDINMDENQKKRILGEANFLKGFAYFYLVVRFGGVPLYDMDNSETAFVRAEESAIWSTVEDHLKEATTLLSWDHEEGRPGLGAAWGLLSKVYAYEKKWEPCKEAAENVINSGHHALYSSYSALYSLDHDNESEHLWVHNARLGSNPITSIVFLPNDVWGGTHSEELGAGWRLVSPTKHFYDAYQPNDVRKKATVAQKDVDVVTYNGSTDTLKAPNNQSPAVCIKYMQPYASGYTQWGSGLNTPVLRYADILLIHAEAIMQIANAGPQNRTTPVTAAATSLNLVRQRAGLSAIASPTFTDLMYERRMELAFEGGDRHFDLVRWQLAEEIYNNLAAEGTYKPKRVYKPNVHNLFPYPQVEIDISNGTLKQNPGYN